ncbi:MAG: preprotein translocase subunit SecG [Idiomarina sp.]|jgi:preprotein translocase subunit SecG|uniref:Protein-export membrane protein SecG n=1 Tax=Idiomarina aquatica TaxID=1327752 RepID=A0A4R6PLC7_9GAMM|nr:MULTISPECIES: preprotein translocase subunit SecG [Idiomarina]MAK71090.1 preprotein translocase subunit SecG [Idiomarinaceae bacterium]MBT41891.1 preprotein translocase subunit SecG [Idiomarina sp.]TDP39007.1 protein translocase subunit secG [Idiomarina aquatica]HAD48349.1 preprotein translocase subunit SecG [Idiomarina sp.]|tara:strand:- start:54 stop:389 length:336 start_codon:yes stop_codon:yes gene_type:complete
MYEVLLVAFLVVAIVLIGFIMIQQGKGADMGASFGAGASNTVFGSGGSGNFLTRTTAALAVVFFILSLVLGNLSTDSSDSGEDFSDLSVPAEEQMQTPTEEDSGSDVPPTN